MWVYGVDIENVNIDADLGCGYRMCLDTYANCFNENTY